MSREKGSFLSRLFKRKEEKKATADLLGEIGSSDEASEEGEQSEEQFFEKMPGTSDEEAKEDEEIEKSSGYYLSDLGKNEEADTKKSRPIFSFRWWEYTILAIEVLLVTYVLMVLLGIVPF